MPYGISFFYNRLLRRFITSEAPASCFIRLAMVIPKPILAPNQ